MAAPAYLSVCCHNTTFVPEENFLFKTGMNIVVISCCAVSVLGVVYLVLPREGATGNTNNTNNQQQQRRSQLLTGPNLNKIIWFIVAANLLGVLGLCVRSIVCLTGWLLPINTTDVGSPQIFCFISTIWVQFFFLSTVFWHFVYAIEAFLTGSNKSCACWLQYVLGWIIPGVLTAVGGWLTFNNQLNSKMRTGFTELIFLVPVVVVIVFNPILLYQATRAVRRTLTGYVGRYTMYERRIIDGIKLKFICIMGLFTVIWLPNLICGILHYLELHVWVNDSTLSNAVDVLWMIMAVLNPFQAMLDALVFWGWPGTDVCRPNIFRTNTMEFSSDSNMFNNINKSSGSVSGSETDPLLSFRRNMQR